MKIITKYFCSYKDDIKSTDQIVADEDFIDSLIQKIANTGMDVHEVEIIKKIIITYTGLHNNIKHGNIKGKEFEDFLKSLNIVSKKETLIKAEISPSTQSNEETSTENKLDDEINVDDNSKNNDSDESANKGKPSRKKKRGGKRKGEGKRNLSEFIDSAPIITHSFHPDFIETFSCPCCAKKDSSYKIEPSTNIYFRRITPIAPEIHVREKVRCHSCGVTLVARASEEVENRVGSFLPSAVTFSILMRYQFGFPFYRMERMLDSLNPNIDFSDATQWDFTQKIAQELEPLLDCLHREAANAQWCR